MPFSVTFIRLFAQTLLHIIVRVQLKGIVERHERLGLAVVRKGIRGRLADSLETALALTGGVAEVEVVGGEVMTAFAPHTHIHRLWSMDKAQSIGAVEDWIRRTEKLSGQDDLQYCVEYKFDGLTLNLTYNEGRLIQAATRGAENTQFLIFLTAVIKAVDEYADVLRISVASAGNDHRLGANEAPPAVVSVFLGDELTEVLKSIENDEYFAGSRAVQMDIGAKVLPHFVKDNTDRNRTSPFAFTGNKFEFRMLGSEASVANPNIILNTAVAECVHQFAEQLKDVPEDKMEDAIHELIKKTIIDHKRVIFNGNGYTDEWIEEAEKRGLFNLKSTPDALPQWIADKNIELFTKYHIFTKEEIESRYEIWLESYSKILNIESNTMVEMVQKDFLPSVFAYIDKVAATAVAKKSVVSDVSTASEGKLIKELSQLADEISTGLETLKADTAKALATEDPLANAKAYQTVVLSDMDELRKSVDAAETLIPDALLPYPTYDKLLFSV